MSEKTDSQRAWELLISRIENIEKVHDKSDEADIKAWDKLQTKCDAYDKALASLVLDIEALRQRIDTLRISSTRTPTQQKVLWAVGTAAAAWLLARVGVDVPALVTLIGKLVGQ